MTDRALVRLAWTACGCVLVLLALGLVLIGLGWSTPLPEGWVPWRGQLVTGVGISGTPVLGGIVAARRPRNLYGWLWLGLGGAISLLFFSQVYAAYALVASPEALPLPRTMGTVVAGFAWTAWLILTPFVLLLFPTGWLPAPRWRALVWVVFVAAAVALVAGPFVPASGNFVPVESPLALAGPAGTVATALTYGATVLILATVPFAALSLVFRFRRASGVERQQIKWFAYAAAVFVFAYLSQFFYEPAGIWDALVEVLPLMGLYSAIGVAILRHRLYDIDVLINRTLVYALLSVTLVLVYLGTVVLLQTLLRSLTGGESQLAVVASTLAIAALFSPLRRGIQRLIDRRFYRNRYDAAKTLEGFGARLRTGTDLDDLSEDLSRVVGDTLAPSHVSLWLRQPKRGAGG